MITEENTIKEAKAEMRKSLKKGGVCPCCNQTYRQYSRTITSAMAWGLILLYRVRHKHEDTNGYMHIENVFKDIPGLPASIRGDIPKLRFWDLLRPEGKEKEDGNPSSGMYMLTEQGKLFVENKLTVPKHVKIYNNKFFGFDPATGSISIQEALKNKFDYDLLMKGEF